MHFYLQRHMWKTATEDDGDEVDASLHFVVHVMDSIILTALTCTNMGSAQ